jgi:hypothetical protein
VRHTLHGSCRLDRLTVRVISAWMLSNMKRSHRVAATPTARPQAAPPTLSCTEMRTASPADWLLPSTHACGDAA